MLPITSTTTMLSITSASSMLPITSTKSTKSTSVYVHTTLYSLCISDNINSL